MPTLAINALIVYRCTMTGFPRSFRLRFVDGTDRDESPLDIASLHWLADTLSGSEWAAFQDAICQMEEWVTV